jgi:sulfoxide reductase heme-binding subunit YedZ
VNSTALWYTTRASGIVALVLLTATMVLGLATTNRARARNWPGYAQQEIHRRLSIVAMVLVGIHVLTSVLDTYVDISWATIVVPFTSSYGRFWVGVGTISLDLMAAVFVSSLLRARMKPGTWRALHWLAYLCWPLALAHTFGMGTDAGEGWVIVLAVVCILSVVASLAWRLRTSARRRAAVPQAPGAARTRPPVERAGRDA